MIKDMALDRFARRCALCGEWACGSWGPKLPDIPPESGVIFTCRAHWVTLYEEADVAARRYEGDIARRPRYLDALGRIGMADKRTFVIGGRPDA